MSSLALVRIHASQFPERVRSELLESLRLGQLNHKFLYDGIKQTQKWLSLHQAFSPARTDPDCAATYDRGFVEAVGRISNRRVHLVGLGCGGGQKDSRLLKLLEEAGKEIWYTPSDVSTAMVLVARQAALEVIPEDHCFPLVCDLAGAEDLASVLDREDVPGSTRLITFFGMLPNFEPETILPRFACLLRQSDLLLLSANLAPGTDYAGGLKQILPQYDNDLTRDWLMTFLLDLGVERADGVLKFTVEDQPSGLKRVAAHFHFVRSRQIQIDSQAIEFQAGQSFRLFYSYRHTPKLARQLLERHGIGLLKQWQTRSQEEGVFLAGRAATERS